MLVPLPVAGGWYHAGGDERAVRQAYACCCGRRCRYDSHVHATVANVCAVLHIRVYKRAPNEILSSQGCRVAVKLGKSCAVACI